MSKRLQEYVKYTIGELDQYVATVGSCVSKVNTTLHFAIGPFCLADFKHILLAHIGRSKVGFYDVQLGGIVLDVKNVKVLGTVGAMRADDARIHININADVYIFKPVEGAVLAGVVKHIGTQHVGVVLYRVFNAHLRVSHKVDKDEIQMEQEVKFRIRNYNLQNVFPYIDGELLTAEGEAIVSKRKKTSFKETDNVDSGIEEKEGLKELDELLSIIKREDPDVYESTPTKKKKSKKRKSSTSLPTSIADSSEETDETPKKIKKEKIKSEDEFTPKKVKKDKKASKTKEKASFGDVNIKQELSDVDD